MFAKTSKEFEGFWKDLEGFWCDFERSLRAVGRSLGGFERIWKDLEGIHTNLKSNSELERIRILEGFWKDLGLI